VSPIAPLRQFVRAFAQRSYPAGTSIVEPFVPSIEPIVSFLFDGTLTVRIAGVPLTPPLAGLVGAHLTLGSLHLEGAVDMFAIFFQPAGFFELFGVPVSETLNSHCELSLVLPGASLLYEQLSESAAFGARVDIAETHLLARVSGVTVSSDMRAANMIARHSGMVNIRALARCFGLSQRQFERRFFAAIGTTPKTFARAARFQAALDAKLRGPNLTWCDVAHAFGYHDQMHLIHDFR
jgi:AraC-like DNA-binding protein